MKAISIICGFIWLACVTCQIVELVPGNISSNLDVWHVDLVITFYAPWCKYCKMLRSSMDQMAEFKADNKHLVFGQFDCEKSTKYTAVCRQFEIDRYPTVYFLGFGDYHQSPKGDLFGKQWNPRLVRYTADMYPEAIYDWIRMLQGISFVKRTWYDLTHIFSSNNRHARLAEKLETENNLLRSKLDLFSWELEKIKADAMFEQLPVNDDCFPLLHSSEPNSSNFPLRACAADMIKEFCK